MKSTMSYDNEMNYEVGEVSAVDASSSGSKYTVVVVVVRDQFESTEEKRRCQGREEEGLQG